MNAIVPAPTQGVDRAEMIRVLGNSLYPGAKPESIELVLSYCRVNGLDPMLKPVHIVPTSVKLPNGQYEMRDVLMPGIADYRIKAARSGEYGGKTEPEFGPDVSEELGGVRVTYPAWCRVTVKRIVQGQAREFTAKERWLENYATAKRETLAPNRMWLKRAYGQLAKCAESQALRMAFPEFSGGYTAEEMEGKTTDGFAGTTIDAEPTPRRQTVVPVVIEEPAHPLLEPNGMQWIKNLDVLLANAQTQDEVVEIADHPSVSASLETAPAAIKTRITELLAKAFARFVEAAPDDADTGQADLEIVGQEKVGAG